MLNKTAKMEVIFQRKKFKVMQLTKLQVITITSNLSAFFLFLHI